MCKSHDVTFWGSTSTRRSESFEFQNEKRACISAQQSCAHQSMSSVICLVMHSALQADCSCCRSLPRRWHVSKHPAALRSPARSLPQACRATGSFKADSPPSCTRRQALAVSLLTASQLQAGIAQSCGYYRHRQPANGPPHFSLLTQGVQQLRKALQRTVISPTDIT